jgi:4-alpha-glucanotransferase
MLSMHARRASGILLHPTSLPGPHGAGDFGPAAYHFVDWLVAAGQGLWQVLPLGPVGPGNSPYMSPSAFAINPLLIDLADLVQRGWLDAGSLAAAIELAGGLAGESVDQAQVARLRMQMLREAAHGFFSSSRSEQRDSSARAARDGDRGDADTDPGFEAFCTAQKDWLDDYALFMTIGERLPGTPWQDWPGPLAQRHAAALERVSHAGDDDIRFWRFVQWTGFRQWRAIRRYANRRGVRIVGDVPIFVAPHSVDVWANPQLFDLDARLRPRVVAGVPPDYFSATGQLWGNPLYRWQKHRDDGFAWWIRRVKALTAQADIVRIDHFRGFAANWEVAADAPNAIEGRWQPGPGAALFEALRSALGNLPIIAEDLGLITEDVTALRKKFALPGMRVLHFAFGSDANNAYLPHNFDKNTVVYTGTHDNDTTLGWFAAIPAHERSFVQTYLKTDGREINWELIHTASESVADLALYPFQDVLGLGSEGRMNRPGIANGCWSWRFDWDQVRDWHGKRLREISAVHGRNGLPLP